MRRFQPIDIIGVVLIVALFITAIRIIGDHLVSPEEEVGAVVEAPGAPEMAIQPEAAAEPEMAMEPEAVAEPEPTPEAAAEPEMAMEPEAVAEAVAAPDAAPQPEVAAEMEGVAEGTSVAALVAAADPGAGEKLFKKHLCFGCHKLEPGKHGAGPSLAGTFGREAAQAEGFKYSKALQDSGIVWTPENLDRWVSNPKAMVKGTKMLLPKPVKDAEDRANLIAYLKEATSE